MAERQFRKTATGLGNNGSKYKVNRLAQQLTKTARQKEPEITRRSKQRQKTIVESKNFLHNLNNYASQFNQKSYIKAYNSVNSDFNPLIDRPQVVNAIVSAIPKCSTSGKFLSQTKSQSLTPMICTPQSMDRQGHKYRCSIKKVSKIKTFLKCNLSEDEIFRNKNIVTIGEKQNYHINDERRELNQIQNWLCNKLQSYEASEEKGESIIVERIHAINMVHHQMCLISGRYSTQLKTILNTVQEQYHKIYQYLINCFCKQNLGMKSRLQEGDQRISDTVHKYESLLLNMKLQHEKKCSRVIENFQKAVELNRHLEKEIKFYKQVYQNERVKSSFVESGMTRLIWLLMQLNSDSALKTNNSIGSIMGEGLKKGNSKDLCYKDTAQNYYKWCSNLLKIVTTLKEKTQYNKGKQKKNKAHLNQTKEKNNKYIHFVASSAITKFMVENDQDLSIEDAKNLLREFAPQNVDTLQDDTASLSQEDADKLGKVQKLQKIYIPSFNEIRDRLKGVEREVQVSQLVETDNKIVQTYIERRDYGTNPHKKFRDMETDTKNLMQARMQIQRTVNDRYKPKKKVTVYVPQSKKLLLKKTIVPESRRELSTKRSVKRKISKRLSSGHSMKKNQMKSSSSILLQDEQKNSSSCSIVDKIKSNSKISKKALSSMTSIYSKKSRAHTQKKSQVSSKFQLASKKFFPLSKPSLTNKSIQRQSKFQLASKKFFPLVQVDAFKLKEESEEAGSQLYLSNYFRNPDQNKTAKSHKFIVASSYIFSAQEIEESDNRVERGIIMNKKTEKILSEKEMKKSNLLSLQNKVEYSSHNQAQILTRMKEQLLRSKQSSKKKINLSINKHEFHLELFTMSQERIKNQIQGQVISSNFHSLGNLANGHCPGAISFKNVQVLKRMKTRIYMNKKLMQANDKNLEMVRRYATNVIDPIIKSYCKLFSESISKGKLKSSKLMTLNLSHYYHRLTPLAYQILDRRNPQGNCIETQRYFNHNQSHNLISNSNMDLRAFRVFKDFEPRMKVYDDLIKGGTLELDIVVKALYYFDILGKQGLYNPEKVRLSLSTIQQKLPLILQDCFDNSQIEIITQVIKILAVKGQSIEANSSRVYHFMSLIDCLDPLPVENGKGYAPAKTVNVDFFWVISKIFRAYQEKKYNLQQKYILITENFSKNSDSISYEDIYYLFQILPLSIEHKNLILKKATNYTIFWEKRYPSIPKDRLFFVFEMLRMINASSADCKRDILSEFILHKAEHKYKRTFNQMRKSAEIAGELVQRKFNLCKIPSIFSKPLFMTWKNKKEVKVTHALLTLLFHQLYDHQNDITCMPILFNGLQAIL